MSQSAPPSGQPDKGLVVGRASEVAAIRAFVSRLASGQGGVLLLTGEAGSGKTTLLKELEGTDRLTLLRAVGDEMSTGFPLLPLVEVAAGRGRPDIGRLLRTWTHNTVDQVTVASEELAAWIDELCTASAVVLVFDDLHWADDASVRLWHRLTRLAVQAPLLVVGAMRPVHDRAELMALRKRLVELEAAGNGALIDLGPLSAEAVRELVRTAVGGKPGKRLVAMASAAGGNPFYLTELLSALVRDGALVSAGNGSVEATRGYEPRSLATAIADRFDLVSPQARDLLRVAALLGVDFSVSDLAAVSGRSVAEMVGMMAEAQAAGVLTSEGQGMAFRHPLIREVLVVQIPEGVRSAWHHEMARVLAQRGAEAPVVARQLVAAIDCGGELPESDWFTDWLVTEGQALTNQAVQIARTLFGHAYERLSVADERRPQVAISLAGALSRLALYSESVRIAEQTLATPGHLAEEDALAIYLVLADCLLMNYRAVEAVERLERAAATREWNRKSLLRIRVIIARGLRVQGETERASEIASDALEATEQGKLGRAWKIASDALEAAEHRGDAWTIGWACNVLAVSLTEQLDFEPAADYLQRGVAVTSGDPELLDLNLSLRANENFLLLSSFRLDELAVKGPQVRRLAERAGNVRRAAHATYFEVIRLYLTGSWDDFFVELESMGSYFPDPASKLFASIVAMRRDDKDCAARYMKILAAMPSRERWGEFALAFERMWAGDSERALELFASIELVWANRWTSAQVYAVRLILSAGDKERVQRIVEAVAGLGDKVHPGVLPHCRGLINRDPDDISAAVAAYREWPQVITLAEALEDLGLVLAERGDQAAARPHMIEALDIYERLDAQWDVKRVRALFREHGMRAGSHETRRRATSGWGSLTATEEAVARLVVDGKSNPQIAEEMFLSKRTVETHVSHILAKLGQRSRVDIARLAASRGSAG